MIRALLALVLLASPAVAQPRELQPREAQQAAGAALGVETGALLGEPAGQPLSGDELERQTKEIAEQIRCPMCRGLPISDSPSQSAAAMRAEARELLARGYTQQQVIGFFEATYGEFVLLDPRTKGNLPLFVAPFLLLAIGGLVVYWRLRQGNRGTVGEELQEEPGLEAYAARVRREVAEETTGESLTGGET